MTLESGGGTCRDYALLMIECCRSLGLAARFITGYLYDPALDTGRARRTTHANPHAWMEVYLPGAGWVEFDPTNGIVGSERLIRVAVGRDPEQAMPIKGTFTGSPEVTVNAIGRTCRCTPCRLRRLLIRQFPCKPAPSAPAAPTPEAPVPAAEPRLRPSPLTSPGDGG